MRAAREALIWTSNPTLDRTLTRNQDCTENLALDVSIVCPTCSKQVGDSVNIRGQFLVKQAERLITIALADVDGVQRQRNGFALHQIV